MIKAKLRHTTTKELRHESTSSTTKLNEIKKLKLFTEQQTKRKLNMLDYKITDTLEELDVDLITLELWNFLKISKKAHDFREERKLRLSAKERINEVDRLKEEVKNK